jgi:hypothetical protein
MTDVACPPAGDCLAAGAYTTGSKSSRLFFIADRQGSWGKGVGVTLPAGAAERQGGYITSMSCPTAGVCVAVGEYSDKAGDTPAMIVTIRR